MYLSLQPGSPCRIAIRHNDHWVKFVVLRRKLAREGGMGKNPFVLQSIRALIKMDTSLRDEANHRLAEKWSAAMKRQYHVFENFDSPLRGVVWPRRA